MSGEQPDRNRGYDCESLGRGHWWTQERKGKWPYEGQPCLCREKKWTKRHGRVSAS